MHHYQFGAGHFGLGFGVWIFFKANLPSIIVARSSRDSRVSSPDTISRERRNELLKARTRFVFNYRDAPADVETPPTQQFEIINYEKFLTYGESSPRVGMLDSSFGDPVPLIFTCSFGNERAYDTALRFVARAVEIREQENIREPIFLMAFENAIPTATIYKKLLVQMGRSSLDHVIPLEVSVDRVCTMFSEISSKKGPVLQIMAARAFSLVIEDKPGIAPLKRLLSPVSGVSFSRNIEIEKKRKRWILNGSHALLGITALFYGFGQFHEYFISDKLRTHPYGAIPPLAERQAFAKALIRELAGGFIADLKNATEGLNYLRRNKKRIAEYEADIFQRYCATYDSTDRIMKNYVAPKFEHDEKTNTYRVINTMEQFFTWMRPRLDEPVKAYMKQKKAAPPTVMFALLHLFELIAGGRFIDTVQLD